MRIFKALLPIALVFFLIGCGESDSPVLSLQPLFTDQDVNFDPALVGTFWAQEDEATFTFTFKKSSGTGYDLVVAGKDKEDEISGAFDAHLVRLGGFWFLDFYPADMPVADDFYRFHFMKGHSIARIWIVGDVVRLALLDSYWVKEGIDEKRLDIRHEIVDGDILLTDTTRAFQDLAYRSGNDPEAFPNIMELSRFPDSTEQNVAIQDKEN